MHALHLSDTAYQLGTSHYPIASVSLNDIIPSTSELMTKVTSWKECIHTSLHYTLYTYAVVYRERMAIGHIKLTVLRALRGSNVPKSSQQSICSYTKAL